MLLDQEALVKQHSGVSTVWLISTLGSKSAHKRISKKDIQSVSIPQTCNVIKNPPRPMALRLTSNLLYGVALVYRQKTDYLNNDAVMIKTRIQRDALYGNKNADRLLIGAGKNLKTSKSGGGGNLTGDTQSRQILLNDDPMFNIQTSLLPSMEGLDFFRNSLDPSEMAKLQRRNRIKEADLTDNHVNVQISSSQASDPYPVSGAGRVVDELDGNNIPEFAFDEDGLLRDLDITGELPNLQHPSNHDDEFGIELDFGYDQDVVPNPETKNDVENLKEMNNIVEKRLPDVETAANPTITQKLKKKRRKKAVKVSIVKIRVDQPICLFTDDLRSARDKYIQNMERPPTKKQKLNDKLERLETFMKTSSFLPTFESTIIPPIEIKRGRPDRRASEDEDFVDGLMRERGSSYSIEIRRNASLDRRQSRSSISSIHLPLNQGSSSPHGRIIDDFFDIDIGHDDQLVPIDQGQGAPDAVVPGDLSKDRSSRKRSSSTVTRFETVREDHVMDFDIGDPRAISGDFINNGSHSGSSSSTITSSQRRKHPELNPEETNSKYRKQTLKFLKYVETRCMEENTNSVTFNQLIDHQSKRSIIVKSFYEILQLTTLNQFEIEVNQPENKRFSLMDASEFKIILR